jgi:Transposase C of IS166 homeodomain
MPCEPSQYLITQVVNRSKPVSSCPLCKMSNGFGVTAHREACVAALLARVRLNVTEEQNRLLRDENQRLKQIAVAHEKLKGEHQQTVERKVLLEEEVRWLKAQYYGRSTQATDAAEQNPDQVMLFNEAEVLAAIEAADEAHRQRTTKIVSGGDITVDFGRLENR